MVQAMVRGRMPHAVLLAGPPGVGKTTLAMDVAAALLCQAPDPAERPCRVCRGCRMVEAGNHPDLHRLAPGGAGAQIGIGGPDRPRGVRDLVAQLSLMPVEGGIRVAVVEAAHRLTDDAQTALLKTLEEPPMGTVIVLCSDEEELLMPTVRSRCARVRLTPVGIRAIESLLDERGLAEPPRAAQLARIAAGRPGLAVAFAHAPEAEQARTEIARQLLDLLEANPADGLAASRDLLARALELVRALEAPPAVFAPQPMPVDGAASTEEMPRGARPPAQDRRRAALALVGIWQDVSRDLAVAALGNLEPVKDIGLLDELEAAAARLPPGHRGHAAMFLARLARATELLEGNVAPELVLDVLVLGWRTRAAAVPASRT
jgi:DNA polymerase-3 subunit delta'